MPNPIIRLRPAEELSALSATELADAIRPLWEDSTWLAGRLQGRVFRSWEALIDSAEAEIGTGSEAEIAALLSSHPRLGANRRHLKQVSVISWQEQGGDHEPEAGAAHRLDTLNAQYEDRFGFPFVEFVAGRPLHEIIPVIETRLEHDRLSELAAGARAMVAIARYRLAHSAIETPAGEPPALGRREVDQS